MDKNFYMMILNEGMYTDNDDTWFVSRFSNEIYRGKLSEENCEYVIYIPEKKHDYKINPRCLKNEDCIICMPDTGSYIWIYNITQCKFEKIYIDNPKGARIEIYDSWIVGTTLWTWSVGLRCLIEVDLVGKRVVEYHEVSGDKDDNYAIQTVKEGQCIYFFSSKHKTLYEFNVNNKEIKETAIPDVGKWISTISYVDGCFWFSGFEDCLYIWNKETEKFICHKAFPSDFRVLKKGERPLFVRSVCLKEYICFIPWNMHGTICNSLLFVNKNDYQMKIVKLYGEGDDGTGCYVLEYIKEERYIGIHYEHNGFISEIDTVTFKITEKRMKFTIENYTKILKSNVNRANILVEKNSKDLPAFLELL